MFFVPSYPILYIDFRLLCTYLYNKLDADDNSAKTMFLNKSDNAFDPEIGLINNYWGEMGVYTGNRQNLENKKKL